jgi:hypothetical protein
MQRAQVELAPLRIGRNQISVKIQLPIDVYREIAETVRRFSKSGLWRVTLYEIFMVGFSSVKREVGLDNFVTLIYRRKTRKGGGVPPNGECEAG